MADKLVFESPRVTLRIGGKPAPSAAPRGARDPFPVIVGCPRSGTSLLAVMLDAHSQLAIPPETAFLPNVMGLAGDPASLRRRFFDIVTDERLTISNWSDFGLDKTCSGAGCRRSPPSPLPRAPGVLRYTAKASTRHAAATRLPVRLHDAAHPGACFPKRISFM
jgi:hypothetical protein